MAYFSLKQPESRQKALMDDASPSAPAGTFNGDGPLSTRLALVKPALGQSRLPGLRHRSRPLRPAQLVG